jgi:hypothetical protein
MQTRKLAAILAADVAGYLRLMADDERAKPECPTLAINGCRRWQPTTSAMPQKADHGA